VAAYIFHLSLSQQISVTNFRYSDDVPGRGYSERFEYDDEERLITVPDGPDDVNMNGPFELRYITFRRGELTYWGKKVEE
jgi:hypothetical protein